MLFENIQVLAAQVLRNDVQFLSRLHVFKLRGVLERKRQFEVIHNVKNDDVVALGSKHFQARDDVIRLIIQIRNQNDKAAPGEVLGQEPKGFTKFSQFARLNAIDFGK